MALAWLVVEATAVSRLRRIFRHRYRLPWTLDRETFLEAVSRLPHSMVRAKGLIEFADRDETMLFQYVCGRFDLSEFRQRGVRERFLTFIGTGGESGIADMLETLSTALLG